jgi:hypothetical protein
MDVPCEGDRKLKLLLLSYILGAHKIMKVAIYLKIILSMILGVLFIKQII